MRRVLDVFFKWLSWGMFLGGLAIVVSSCGLSGEKSSAQYAEELMEDDIELEPQGDDAMALIEKVSGLFRCKETESGYRLGGTTEDIQIRTETELIYNHFPDLPGTSEMQWCSESSEGIGLNTVRIYIFAYYDHDITGELQGMKFDDYDDVVELRFVPEGISREQRWRIAEDVPFAFQEDIKDTRKMNTTVYINEQGTVLYIEAIGD